MAMAVIVVLLLAGPALCAQQQEQQRPEARPDQLSAAEISRALDAVAKDPNLSPSRTIKTLHWKTTGQSRGQVNPVWFAWIAGLIYWLSQSMRWLMRGGFLVLAIALVVYVVRRIHRRHDGAGSLGFTLPTHVGDLDIRPESLPDDIGGTARALWDRGEHRAALALLYRGMLSRLAHVHEVPIRDSSTEGDCLSLASHHLTLTRHDYVRRLVQVWQRFVYGGEDVAAPAVYGLCNTFATTLDTPSETHTTEAGS